MVNKDKIFLIDTSALITPYRQYYAFDLVPSFWEKIKECFESGKIVILDKVWRELEKGGSDDKLSGWLSNNKSLVTIRTYKTETIIRNYADVLQYIQTSDLYYESAIAAWAVEEIADPWIIAAARADDYIIVTEEQGSKGIGPKQKNKNPKIPDVAKALGVETISLFEMMRRLKIKI